MKKALTFFLVLLLLAPLSMTTANAVASEVTIENLATNAESFNGRLVTLQGFLVIEQRIAKPTSYYVRDSLNNMIQLKFPNTLGLSSYAGKLMEVTGVFNAGGKEMQLQVSGLTPLEEAGPESQLVTGEQKTLVVMAYFTDRTNTVSVGGVWRMVFNDMNGYYMEASYDLLYVTGSYSGWHQLDNNVKYYGQDNPSWYFIRDAVAEADSYVNFAAYSRFLFVNAGPNEESSGVDSDIWSARWSGLSIATNDAYTLTHGAIVPDVEAGAYGALGVTAHEYGHELGLPDLYGYAGGVGNWDLMATGTWNNLGNTPAQPTSYCKLLQGWMASSKIRYIYSGTAELLMLDPLEDSTATIQVIRLPVGSSYYLIEARRKVGYDSYLPGEKVLVLYWDAAASKLYLKATLSPGGSFRSGNVEVMVTKEDMENWSFQVYVSYKSWSADIRLTSNTASSYTNWRGGAVASAGSYVYVTWEEYRDGNSEIYFKRSTTSGWLWGADTRLTSNTASSWYPSIAAYGSYVYVVWQDYRDGNWEIYLLRSENYGASWYSAIRLTSNTGSSTYASVAAYARNVHVAWQDNRSGNWEIYYKRSIDNGLTWGSDTRLTSDSNISEYPSVTAFRSNVFVAWDDNRTGNYDIFVKKSADNGATWTQKQLTTNTASQKYPSIATYGYDVHVVWTDFRNVGNDEIYYRRSLDSGGTYKAETRLTTSTGSSLYASVAARGKTVYVVWQDYKTGQWEVFFKDSPDRGLHWTADRILSAQPNYSGMPSVSVAGDNVYVAWTDFRNGNYEVYFKYRW